MVPSKPKSHVNAGKERNEPIQCDIKPCCEGVLAAGQGAKCVESSRIDVRHKLRILGQFPGNSGLESPNPKSTGCGLQQMMHIY